MHPCTHLLIHFICVFVNNQEAAFFATLPDPIHHLLMAAAIHLIAFHSHQSVHFLQTCSFCWASSVYVLDEVSCMVLISTLSELSLLSPDCRSMLMKITVMFK